MITPKKPLISICASRTGSGKSPMSRWLVRTLKEMGYKVVVIRHPMPYGDLVKQRLQRFETYADLDLHECTVEEREDYEPHLDNGAIVYSGVDYQDIINAAEKEADIVVWDGGNNDFPFYKPSKHIVIVDPHRVGHELYYYPGETNVRMADIVIVSKVNTAKPEDVKQIKENVRRSTRCGDNRCEHLDHSRGREQANRQEGSCYRGWSHTYPWRDEVRCSHYQGKGDGCHIVDPSPTRRVLSRRSIISGHILGALLPAVGYSEHQMKELEESINAVPCDMC